MSLSTVVLGTVVLVLDGVYDIQSCGPRCMESAVWVVLDAVVLKYCVMVCYAQCYGNTWMVWLSAMVLLGVGIYVYMSSIYDSSCCSCIQLSNTLWVGFNWVACLSSSLCLYAEDN